MKKITVAVLITFCYLSYAQTEEKKNMAKISGRVLDFESKNAIEYANVIVYNLPDSSQVTGGITNKEGIFLLDGIPNGKYYVSVKFIGYEKRIIENILVTSSNIIDLGEIFIKITSINFENVVVEGERNPVSFQLDRKVIDVSKMPTSISGNAADVLENVPSVTVDIDGNVSLRGSSNFTVLIDGRPSVMEAQDALQQIPASSIETIEIITNPSAKYDPEGSAGIINIKIKKEKNLGLSGIANANAGANDKYGGDFIIENKTSGYSYNFGINYNRRFSPGSGLDNKQFEINNNTSFLNSNGSREHGHISFGLRGGFDFNLSGSDLLSISGGYGTREHQSNNTSNYIQWSDLNPVRLYYLNIDNSNRSGYYYVFNTGYTKKINMEGHQLQSEFLVSRNNADEFSVSSSHQDGAQTDGKKTTESGPSTHIRGKIDYTLPLDDNTRFEAGSQGEIELEKNSNGIYNYDALNHSYNFQSLYSHTINSTISELAIYSIYSNEWNNLNYQAGLRTEFTYRTIELTDNQNEFLLNRWDFFPSIHSSYKFTNVTQFMASYTRRIDRPHGWNLEPFLTWSDPNNVQIGNPDLKPELIDSYELGFQTLFGTITFNNDIYYRVNHNRIDRIQSAYAENITLNTFANVGTDYSFGTELMITFDPFAKVWNVNLMADVYDYRIKGILNEIPFERKSFNWNARVNNGFNIAQNTQLQFNIRYHSPSVSSQGRYEGHLQTDIAVKQDLFDKAVSLTLQARDLFKTGKREFTSRGSDFYSYTYYTREAPMVMLNMRLNFNNFNEKKDRDINTPDNRAGQEEEY